MAERSFKEEVELLRKGDGDIFEGEGILAITKGLLQAGVSYVGGYQGSPISHLVDVMNDATPLLDELGVHFEQNTNEASAAAMLAASVNYPLRGAVTWKSTVGTNVASDALSNLASAGVKGGALIIMGEDYGEGASIMQERSHAFAMKSQMWLMDPRPDHARMVELIEKGFELSEASHTPVLMEFRIRTCHMRGRFVTKDNKKPAHSRNNPITEPEYDYGKIVLPPSTYSQEQEKIKVRWPAAEDFIRREKLNETLPGRYEDIGIIMQGGLYNTVLRALQQVGLADIFGKSEVPLHILNVTYPLLGDEISGFCAGKRAVLVVEEGQPAYIEEAIEAILRKAEVNNCTIVGKQVLPMAGEYTAEVMLEGVTKFLEGAVPRGLDLTFIGKPLAHVKSVKSKAMEILGGPMPGRPPGFCTGCPERPVFSAIKLTQRDIGKFHVSSDIGCHTFSTLPPFNLGSNVMGFGLGLSSSAALTPVFGDKRVVSIMGDGGFWHNGLTTGVMSAVTNKTDGVLVIMNNGYTSATGQQYIPSSFAKPEGERITIESMLSSVGVKWVKTVNTYRVSKMRATLHEAMTTAEKGLKVIVAEGECMLAKQRRFKPWFAKKVAAGDRVVRTRFGVDDAVCTGDHSCIRLSGCPSLTVKDTNDPLRSDPVAYVNNDCVGCGLCGEVADAAILCPSFYKAEIVKNPNAWDRFIFGVRQAVIRTLQRWAEGPVRAVA
jgi:indolepyruvate ferredoxin oxidoreductase alpha subunit